MMPKKSRKGKNSQGCRIHRQTITILRQFRLLYILVVRVLVPIIILASGLIVLALRLSGWSLIFGLPLLITGFTFLIFTYDDIITTRVVKFDNFESSEKETKEET
jgi:hypothetical protein